MTSVCKNLTFLCMNSTFLYYIRISYVLNEKNVICQMTPFVKTVLCSIFKVQGDTVKWYLLSPNSEKILFWLKQNVLFANKHNLTFTVVTLCFQPLVLL